MFDSLLRSAVIATAFTAGAISARAQFMYTAIDLTPGLGHSEAFAINNAGQVTGESPSGTAFLYSNGVMTNLGSLSSYGSIGYAINQSGEVVGETAAANNSVTHAFSDIGGTMSDLGTLPGSTTSVAYAVNSSGQVVGYATSLYNRAFLLSGGTMYNLGTLGGTGSTSSSGARDINDTGQVVGWASTASGRIHAFSYSNGLMSDLGAVEGANGWSDAFGINASGQIVGESTTLNGGVNHAFLYSGGNMVDLGTLGGPQSSADDINASGQIVGYSLTPDSGTSSRAFLYSGGTMLNLNSVTDLSHTNFATLDEAYAINDAGYIVGYGHTTGGTINAFLLTPLSLTAVPEPALGGAAVAAVLVGLATRRWTKRRRVAEADRG